VHRIVAVGPGLDTAGADRVIDARGLVVTPGFVDVQTHYDAQVGWDPLLTCSSWHGVTTAVLGNCGFAIPPRRPQHRAVVIFDPDRIRALPPEKVRDLPGGEPRLISRCEGMRYVAVNGAVLLEDGEPVAAAGCWPGRVPRRFDD
jgi:N-acyl-D-aspartate/D-glutamate deacylase